MQNGSRVIVALDRGMVFRAAELANACQGQCRAVKVGPALLSRVGLVEFTNSAPRIDIFADFKFHDTPETVYAAVKDLTTVEGVTMLTVHAMGGIQMMEKAAKAARKSAVALRRQPPKVFAITLLSTLSTLELHQLGLLPESIRLILGQDAHKDAVQREMDRIIVSLASAAKEAGLDGVVCGGQDVAMLRRVFPEPSFAIVAAGIRPSWYTARDEDAQKRIATPSAAINDGADYIVVGRPITLPSAGMENPVEVLARINEEVAACRRPSIVS